MAESHSLGKLGEQMAERLLVSKGYSIREKNWRSGRKEVDIIVESEKFIVFVEVKTRTSGYQVSPLEAVTTPKQRHLIYAAESYIKLHGIEKDIRFDIITMVTDGKSFSTEHIEDAFYPTL
jgi:putative endonuclease